MHRAYTWQHSVMSNSERWLERGLIEHLSKRIIHLEKFLDETKEEDFEFLVWQIVGR